MNDPLEEFDDLIIKSAEKFRLDANLIRAIIMVESSGDPNAIRFEPKWHLFNNPSMYADKLGISRDEEEENQATSWGLGQIIGAVARDLGFTDDLTMLLVPEINLFYCSKKLRQLMDRFDNEEKVVSAYNCGTPRLINGQWSNYRYVDKVFSYLRKFRKLT